MPQASKEGQYNQSPPLEEKGGVSQETFPDMKSPFVKMLEGRWDLEMVHQPCQNQCAPRRGNILERGRSQAEISAQ